MMCPRCKNVLKKLTVKIEGKWAYLWMCNCHPNQEEIRELEQKYLTTFRREASSLPASHLALEVK